jgi:serine/threonine protein kinase
LLSKFCPKGLLRIVIVWTVSSAKQKPLPHLNHQNIAHIYEINESERINFIVMELIDGETLRTRILQGPLGLQEVLDITTQSASALVAAHEAAIIHRDIKPRT